MRNKVLKYTAISLLVFFCTNFFTTYAQSSISIGATVLPNDASFFIATDLANGAGECSLTWTTSPTPNIVTQRIEITGPQGPGIDFTTQDLTPFPGASTPDNYDLYTPNTNVIDLVIGWPYILRHVSIAGSLESNGVWTTCTPTSALPAPVMTAEPATTEGTTNTVFWDNGGIDDGNLECNVQLSTTDLNVDPLTFQQESGWTPCPSSTETYEHTFSGLSYNTTYFYHVQSRTTADGLSPFSNVVFSTQIDPGGGTVVVIPDPGGGGGGGRPPAPTAECGDGTLDSGETCDDGNTISGDGCSASCDIEHPAAEECGNSIVEAGETCDDGNVISGDGCDAACQLEPSEECGNGTLEAPEQCDDGNILPGDGCNEVCELEVVEVRFEIKGAPEFRVPHTSDPNLSLNSQFLVHKPAIANTDAVQIKLDDFGDAVYEGEIVTGTYDFGLNGEAHNTKLIRGIEIDPTTEVVVLDFTYADTVELIAGDTVDNNYINGVDMSKLIQQYRMQGTEVLSDLNKEGYVNGIDASILITNYRKSGESF